MMGSFIPLNCTRDFQSEIRQMEGAKRTRKREDKQL
jgi:hypothetical protein